MKDFKIKKIKLFFLLCILLGFSMQRAVAALGQPIVDPDFDFSLRAAGVFSDYSGAGFRDSMSQFSESLDVVYKKHYGFNIGGTIARYYFNDDVNPVYIASTFSKIFGSFSSELIRGRLGLRVGLINTQSYARDESNTVTNNNSVTSNNVVVLSGVAYYRSNGGVNLDYGVITTRYFDVTDLSPIDVVQQNVTAGFTFNAGYDWLQYRSSAIDIEATENKSYLSHKLQYSHWFRPSSGKTKLSLHLLAIAGERQYGVIEETSVVYNYADKQRQSYMAGLVWKPNSASVSLFAGREFYQKQNSADVYYSTYIYLAVGNDW